MMFTGWWHVLPDEERQQWALEPFVAVGPLRFGMTPEQVAGALATVTTQKDSEFGLQLYYQDERLTGVAIDALRGPQVSVAGTALVGRVPSLLEQWLTDRAEARPAETELVYLSAGVPASESLGVTINVQREGDRLLTRPVFYPAEALDDLPHWLPQEAWAIHD